MRGFTTVRDLGGPVFGLKRAIDEGVDDWSAHLSRRALLSRKHQDMETFGSASRFRGCSAVH